ncbi:MAG TPA: hypothetical protein VMU62_10025 [Acidobacteriaceae bacterium]|nr:hypothetical protein [Acidobacteriaceae bacterium]
MKTSASSRRADPRLAAAMWTSLRALAASHVAMYTIAQPSAAWTILSNSANEIRLRNLRGTLRWTSPDATGTGIWQILVPPGNLVKKYGSYTFTEKGLLRFQDEEISLEIETAVERQLQELQQLQQRPGTEKRA